MPSTFPRARVTGRLARRRRAAARAPMRRRRPFAMRNVANRPLARYIRQVMRREEETKYVANQYDAGLVPLANQWYSNGDLGAVGNWYPAIPKLAQGTGDYQRVGNKINPVSVAVSLKIHFNPGYTKAASLWCVVFYGTSKASKSWNVDNPVDNTQILDQGDGTNTDFDGTLYKLNHPVDKHQFNFKRIVFRLTKTEGYMNTDISGNATVVSGSYATANGPQCKNLLLKFTPPKQVMYESNTDGWPSNYAPVYAVGFVHCDGSPLTLEDKALVQVSSQCHMYYKDA